MYFVNQITPPNSERVVIMLDFEMIIIEYPALTGGRHFIVQIWSIVIIMGDHDLKCEQVASEIPQLKNKSYWNYVLENFGNFYNRWEIEY